MLVMTAEKEEREIFSLEKTQVIKGIRLKDMGYLLHLSEKLC